MAAVLATAVIPGCTRSAAPVAPPVGTLRAVVSIAPLKSLVEGVVPPGSTVTLLIPPGTSEHGAEIAPDKLMELARADLVAIVGFGLEPQVEKFLAANPREGRRVVKLADTAAAPPAATADADDDHDEHNDHDEHHHGGIDPHAWLDPVCVLAFDERLAQTVASILAERHAPPVDPARLAAARASIEAVDRAYRDATANPKRRTLVVGHDAFGWLARRYNLRTVAVHGLSATEPTPAAIHDAIETIKAEHLTTVFVEPQISPAMSQRIAEATGAKIVKFDPLGDGDWAALMNANLAVLKTALND